MKTCLINPPSFLNADQASDYFNRPPLSILTLGTILKNKNKPVELLDLQLLINQKVLRFDRSFYKAAVKLIGAKCADVLGFTAVCSNYPLSLNLARECKRANPRYKIIFGGPQATATGEETMRKFPFIDIVVYGEADITLVEVIDRLEKGESLAGVAGISYREGPKIVHNGKRELIKDLNELPLLDYGLAVPLSEYQGKQKSYVASIEVGRGCPYNCVYCSTSVHWGRRFRLKSAERIVAELVYLKQRYKIGSFAFQHDLFTLDRQKLRELCELMITKKLGVTWTCSSRIDSLDVEDDTLTLMARAGCEGIFYGVETGSERMQRLIKKRINLKRVEHIIRETIKNNIECAASFIIGFPEEKEADLNDTLILALKLSNVGPKVNIRLYLAAPVAGSELMETNKKSLALTYCYSDFNDITSCLGTKREEIKKYPGLFSSFYNLKTKYLPLELFIFAQDWLFPVIQYLPKSFALLCDELKAAPLEVLYLWINWFNKNEHLIESPVLTHKSMDYFCKFAKEIHREKKIEALFLFDLLKYETVIYNVQFIKKSLTAGTVKQTRRMKGDWVMIAPKISEQVIYGSFNYDVKKYMELGKRMGAQKSGRNRKVSYLFYKINGEIDARKISARTREFIGGMDGTKSLEEIAEDYKRTYPVAKQKIKAFIKNAVKDGIVELESL